MLSFLAQHPPRTKVSDKNIIAFDSGRSQIEFKSPTDRYLVINRWPPAAPDADVASGKAFSKGNCAIAPAPHWHRYQSEEFHVLKGRAYFWIDDKERIAEKGEVVTVPKGAFHMFRNASDEDGMEIEFVLDPKRRERDEDFFRNLQTYRDDCRKAGIPRSMFQIWLFLRSADTYPVMPGPTWLAKPLGMLVNLIGGLMIGKCLLGYKERYPEYTKYSTY